MAKPKPRRIRAGSSPRLEIELTPENLERAKQSQSHACVIADAIKQLGYHRPSVDMATIRFTDPESGQRYTYLTPGIAQHILLAFDQGWPNPADRFELTRAVKIDPVKRFPFSAKNRAARLKELEGKEKAGTITPGELSGLTRMRRLDEKAPRASSGGKAKINPATKAVVGGERMVSRDSNPNLLHSSRRHYATKQAQPGQVFQAAVDEAVKEKLAEQADAAS